MEYNLDEEIQSELILFEKTPSYDCVYENIYIGNYASALQKDILKQMGITHILITGKNLKEMFPNDFKYNIIPLYDSEYTKLDIYIEKSNSFIEEGNSKGKILVHCGHGISRSVSMVLAYIISMKKIPYSKAISLIKEKRAIAKPNSGFEKQLRNFSYDTLKEF
jgi:atypical dual specificity phosphatase